MRAIVLEKFGGLDSLICKDIPEPEPEAIRWLSRSRRSALTTRRCICAVASASSAKDCIALPLWHWPNVFPPGPILIEATRQNRIPFIGKAMTGRPARILCLDDQAMGLEVRKARLE